MSPQPQPLLELLTPKQFLARDMRFDVLRMRVPGGWLVTTVVVLQVAREQVGMQETTVFVSDPLGTWSPQVQASEGGAQP